MGIPPTILETLLAPPQVQGPGAAVGDGGGGGGGGGGGVGDGVGRLNNSSKIWATHDIER